MKQLAFLLAFMSWSITVSAQTVDIESIDFVKKFYKAVVAHKQSKVIKCMDKTYRKEQIAFLKGNKQQFVNELFGGYNIETDEFVNVRLEEIENIEIQEVSEPAELETGEILWFYIFHVQTKDRTIKVSLDLKKSGKKYGFIGSVG